MTDALTDYLTAVEGMAAGLWWLWIFLGTLLLALLAYNGCCAALDRLDRLTEEWHESRGHVRAVGADGREQWIPVHPESSTARQLDELRNLPEVRRG